MKSKEFEEKFRRIQELESTIHHQTTLANAISALEHGLMPLEELEKRKIEFEWGGYVFNNPHYRPDAVGFHKAWWNFLRKGSKNAAFLSNRNPYLIIDDKYTPLLEEEFGVPHPTIKVYKGVIPSEDILALAVPINSTMREHKVIGKCGEVTIHSNSRDREWIFKPVEEAMELQRKELASHKLTPLYYYHQDSMLYEGSHIAYLYVPEWLEVSSEIRVQARPLEPF